MPQLGDLKLNAKAAKAMSQVVMCFLGQGGDGLRGAGSGCRGLLGRSIDRDHGMVRDVAEPMGLVGPSLGGVGGDRDSIKGSTRTFGAASRVGHGQQGSADSPHPVIDLAA